MQMRWPITIGPAARTHLWAITRIGTSTQTVPPGSTVPCWAGSHSFLEAVIARITDTPSFQVRHSRGLPRLPHALAGPSEHRLLDRVRPLVPYHGPGRAAAQ